MSVTLAQLRAKVYALLREDSTNTHFADTTVIDGFLNEGSEFSAVFIEYPRAIVSVQAGNNTGSYSNPSDNLLVRTAYFGDASIAGDIRPLKIVSEETLREFYPSWLDQSVSGTSDRPEYLIQIDRRTVHVFPRPNATGAATGKKVWLNYNYVPAAMTNDSDVPDLPVPYHNLLPLYALHLAYIALQNVPLAKEMYTEFMDKVQRIKSAVTKETKEGLSFSWGTDIDVDMSGGMGIKFT